MATIPVSSALLPVSRRDRPPARPLPRWVRLGVRAGLGAVLALTLVIVGSGIVVGRAADGLVQALPAFEAMHAEFVKA